MNGAESLVRTLIACGIDTCFANPGTSEMHFVAALDRIPGLEVLPCLQENVVTGAADGYGRMADKPAAALLHCGPGLANGLSNLHNAMRARTPVVTLVGDQATYHAPLDPPLASDIESLGKPVARWTGRTERVGDAGRDASLAVAASMSAARGVSILTLPSDVCWNEGGNVAPPAPVAGPFPVAAETVSRAAKALRSGENCVLLLGGWALRRRETAIAASIAARTGARLFAPSQIARMERGAGTHAITRIPYAIDAAREALANVTDIVLVGATQPVAFFAYPGKPGMPQADTCRFHTLAEPDQNVPDALERLADLLSARPVEPPAPAPLEGLPTGEIDPRSVAAALRALMPQQAVVVDEGVSFGRLFFDGTAGANPHDWLQLTGGAIGSGIPMATGAAVAARGRRVVNLQADGSALYTVQGLWTQARENLPVTTVILANRRYAILDNELKNVGATSGAVSQALFDIGKPDINWIDLAGSLGVEAARADTLERFMDLFGTANAGTSPFLIELVIA